MCQRPDMDDLPHTWWYCKSCKGQNSCLDGDCQWCIVDNLSLYHEDDCTGYVSLHKALHGSTPYLVRGTRIAFTQLGDDAPVTLTHEGKSKTFATERLACEAIAKKAPR